MLRSPTNASVPAGFDLDFEPFSVEWLVGLIQTVGLPATIDQPEQLADFVNEMNAAAIIWRYQIEADKAPSELSLRNDMERIRDHSSGLLELLPIVWDEGIGDGARVNPHIIAGIANSLLEAMEYPEPSGVRPNENPDPDDFWVDADLSFDTPRDKLLAMVETLEKIRDAAGIVVNRIGKPDRAAPKSADRDFAYKLAVFYQDLFGKAPSLSRDSVTGEPGGPFLRFASACFIAVDGSRPDETIASWIRDWRANQEKQTSRT